MDDRLYRAFAEIEDHHWWFVARRAILGRLIARWVPDGATILDVGCGTGGFIADIQGRYDVRGVDPAAAAVAACRARGLNAVSQGSAADPASWGSLPVDVVTFLDVVEHLEDDVSALRAARAALRPGGRVIVTVPAYQWLWSDHDVRNQHYRRYTIKRLRRAHAAAGLRPLQSGYFNALLFPFAVLQRGLAALRTDHDLLSVPAEPVNRMLQSIFSSEGSVIAGLGRSFPYGLSAFCVSAADGS